jgi:hypothetical protein
VIIVNHKYGRLGNHFEHAAHLIVFSIIFETPISLLFMSGLQKYFPYFADNNWMIYPKDKNSKIHNKFFLILLLACKKTKIVKECDYLSENKLFLFDKSKANNNIVQKLTSSKFVFLKAWRFKSSHISEESINIIRKVFTPSNSILIRSKNIRYALCADVLIAVHIRWGDLKETDSPDYIPLEQYVDCMNNSVKEFYPKKVGFIISSEEKEIPGLHDFNHIHSGGTPIEDIYVLAEADYIISNGSTFSRWASFWGGKPMYTLKKQCTHHRIARDSKVFIWDFTYSKQAKTKTVKS